MLKLLKKLFRRNPKAVMIRNIRFRQLDEEIRNKMVDGLGDDK
jgi:hypothetical protein